MCVRSAIPEISSSFSALCIENTRILGIRRELLWPMVCRGMRVRSATPANPSIFLHCALRTHPSQVSKNSFSGPWCAEVCVYGAPAQKPPAFFCIAALQTHPSQVSKNSFSGSWCAEVCVYGAPTQKPPVVFCIEHCKHTHLMYPETPFLPFGVQRYVCTERHPRNPQCYSALRIANTPIPGI